MPRSSVSFLGLKLKVPSTATSSLILKVFGMIFYPILSGLAWIPFRLTALLVFLTAATLARFVAFGWCDQALASAIDSKHTMY